METASIQAPGERDMGCVIQPLSEEFLYGSPEVMGRRLDRVLYPAKRRPGHDGWEE
jgi:hypothetical protein